MELVWKTATACTGATNCVQVAFATDGSGDVFLRDSDKPAIILRYTAKEWEAFVLGVHDGEFDVR